ncbi:RNA-directed DNA polymerase from mobile element jockey [Plakobranchus ocellatus]|uniref:RNA-directed DNA polymerase from mobile element jockey n=1 Tax=Plakobranchus ocellatus TaxID=259542 RepID=A0AAV3YYN4_9GAST|nr:RNA-directed DNA polymerase from mobile element jockey [Plakobranchus ocellatus]
MYKQCSKVGLREQFQIFDFENHLCHFHKEFSTEPALHLDCQPIPVKGEAKFLGVVFDSKLPFSSHVKYIKKKCLKTLNLLRVIGHTDWGAERATFLKLYCTLVQSKIDYGSIVYGSLKTHVLRALDSIHHQGLRIAPGSFRTSPIKSLYTEAGEPSLEHWRIKLAFNYVLKLKSLPRNPCHDVVFETLLSDFSADTKSGPNLVASTFERIKNAKINIHLSLTLRSIDSESTLLDGVDKSVPSSTAEVPDSPQLNACDESQAANSEQLNVTGKMQTTTNYEHSLSEDLLAGEEENFKASYTDDDDDDDEDHITVTLSNTSTSTPTIYTSSRDYGTSSKIEIGETNNVQVTEADDDDDLSNLDPGPALDFIEEEPQV